MMLGVFIWIFMYGGTHIMAESVSRVLHIGRWGNGIAMLMYAILLILWLYRTGQSADIGLCSCVTYILQEKARLILLCVFPVFNIIIMRGAVMVVADIVYMVSVAVVEEIFFRGFLLHHLIRRGARYAIVVSSIVFAGFHFVNLFQCTDKAYILLQVLAAFGAGVCYSAITVRYHSLIPSMVAHALTNITGMKHCSDITQCNCIWWVLACVAIYIWYGTFLCRKINL